MKSMVIKHWPLYSNFWQQVGTTMDEWSADEGSE